jgi:phenylpropionate dioxygenase-like ring-hydroxylating dioxygenase large terminal subunit
LNVQQTVGFGWSAADLARAGLTEIREMYTSPIFSALEQRRLFWESWSLIASSEHLPPRRYLAVTVAGAPIAVWRDGQGVCRAVHNLCRHRGIPLLEGEGDLGKFITCPYHHWSYNLDGDLIRVPQPDQFPDIEMSELGLQPVPVVEWHGMIFVCPSSDPPDFHRQMELLTVQLGSHLALPLVEVARVDYTVNCNWKLLVENHVDVYHLGYLHQRSLAAYRHPSFEWRWEGPTWWSWEPLKDRSAARPGLGGLTADGREGIGAHLLFPNLMIVTTGDYLATYDARPVGPDRTAMTLRIRSSPGADEEELVASVRAFLAEDVKACDALQTAIGSPLFQIGPTAAHHEEPVRIFHSLLRSRVLAP